ncbi:PorT family protein [Spirosoma agri]|uniref:PorT family protein n=1 Tax=Spirosoma agri TaxID=1987381 RepID=A0A6M0INA1_9BACT|nr:PorT family protein [Spirosoma agri]NEU69417.1 PorT family protein [Spirosoma agri]
MRTQLTLLASCLLGVGLATGQSTTNMSSTTSGTSTYNASPVTDTTSTSNTTYSTTPTTTDNSSNTNSTYSTTPSTNSYNNANAGTTTTTTTDYNTTSTRDKKANDYKNFVFGIYAGLNTTKFKGEAVNPTGGNDKLTGRLGYQAGFFVRGGGRLFGQIGAEYFASSSNYFVAGSGQSASDIKDRIDLKYIQVPVYIGYKLVESDRGISAVRLQLGVEYANRIGSSSNSFGNLNNLEFKNGTFNGLGQLGFDAGPVFLDLTYHYGFSNTIAQNNGFAGSARRILSASVGFKF